jgi:hypothetical protein
MGGAGASLFCSSVYIYMYISPLYLVVLIN